MTEAEMKAAAERLDAIRAAKERLARAREVLALVNKYGKSGSVWRPSLQLKEPTPYSVYDRGASIAVAIPFGVIQQQAVYAVQAARREVIRLGGQP